LDLQLDDSQEKATILRRERAAQEDLRKSLESEVNSLNTVCDQRRRANEGLQRELEQIAEDDEIIRSRLERYSRVAEMKGKNREEIKRSWNMVEASKSPIKRL